MPPNRDRLAPLRSRIGQAMLASKNLARLGYVATDGKPRVTPVWFHWNGTEIVICSERNFKVKSISLRPTVAISIDDTTVPYDGLHLGGTARVGLLDDMAPEVPDMAARYLGEEQGRKYVKWAKEQYSLTARIAITPEWARITDYREEFEKAFAG